MKYTMANTIDDLKSYREVVDHFKQAHRKINLLLGNGFSIAYDRCIISYNAISRFIMEFDDEIIKKEFRLKVNVQREAEHPERAYAFIKGDFVNKNIFDRFFMCKCSGIKSLDVSYWASRDV